MIAVDARVKVLPEARTRRGAGHPRFAVRPYPKEWERSITLKSGRKVGIDFSSAFSGSVTFAVPGPRCDPVGRTGGGPVSLSVIVPVADSPRVKLEKRHALTEPSACDGDALRM